MKNLKTVFFFFSLIFVVGTVQAQLSIGPKIGINLATAGGDDVDDIKSHLGFQFGAAAEIGISEKFAIQPELLFFQKGSKTEFGFLGTNLKIEQILNYLEIPILAKVMFGGEGGAQFFATVGPSFGFGLGGKVKTGGQETDINFGDDMLKKLDISASIGAGAQFAAGPGNLFVEARYLLGLSSLDDSSQEADVKNRGFGISAGLLFPL